MLRAWRNELGCILATGLALLIAGVAIGGPQILLGIGLVAYVGWHVFHFLWLQHWIAHSQRSRLPLSFGIWEEIFDGLQRRQLRHRRRRSSLVRHLREARDAGDRLPDALILLDKENTVLWFNPAAARLLALTRRRDRGRKVADLIQHPALQDAVAGAGSSRPLEIAAPANRAWMLSVQITGLFGDSGRRMLVAQDITRFYREEQVRRDFLANVSHELRTPITVFRGYLGALRRDPASTLWAVPLGSMAEQAQRMQALVDDLLLLSRLEMTRSAPTADLVDVSGMLAAILEEARALRGDKRQELALEADPTVGLRGDEDELRSAFSNLIFNAVRHTPPDSRIAVIWKGSADHASLSVRDSGPGIAPHHLPRLTERFYRVDSSRSRRDGGTGLGLAIVKQVLERHGAELRIASEPGQGSVFSCHFPGALVDIEETPQPAEKARLRGERPER